MNLKEDIKLTKVIVEMKQIVKKFPGIIANDHINLTVFAGEVHALLGENGAGKTTLMNILSGKYKPDSGEILINGQKISMNPKNAIKHGIGMVHQHFRLVSSLTIAENLTLGFSEADFFFPEYKVTEKIKELSKRYNLHVDPNAKIWQLSVGEQQRVEILRALSRNANILVLDEPTSVLTPGEVNGLFEILKSIVKEKRSVIFITHKLNEALAISDRITVLKNGKIVNTLRRAETNNSQLVKMMIGRDVLFHLEKKPTIVGNVILKIKNIHAKNDRGLPALRGISLTLHENEILGVAGVAGNGQRELVEVITGLRKIDKGEIEIKTVNIAHIPEERIKMGIVPNMSVAENLVLNSYHNSPFSKWIILNISYMEKHAEKLISKFNIITPSRDTPVKLLSGGNIQRLILARETSGKPKLIVASHPTYGLDIGATEHIRQFLLNQKEEGTSILLVSEDLDEIISLSDRIAVIYDGKIMGIVEADSTKIEEIGMMMTGIKHMTS
jgi:ABC-type uncharacterized transport system ATPase subunit